MNSQRVHIYLNTDRGFTLQDSEWQHNPALSTALYHDHYSSPTRRVRGQRYQIRQTSTSTTIIVHTISPPSVHHANQAYDNDGVRMDVRRHVQHLSHLQLQFYDSSKGSYNMPGYGGHFYLCHLVPKR